MTHKPTIYEVLRDKLGREPTHNELVADVRRILFGTPTGDDACRICRDQCACHATSTVCGLCNRTTEPQRKGVTT